MRRCHFIVSKKILDSVKVRLDIKGLDPHDFLDYKLYYQKYLDYIYYICRSYISSVHFKQIFLYNPKMLRADLSAMVKKNWLGTFKLGKHRFYFLKRKALLCILGGGNLTDSSYPTMRQLVRSLMICEVFLNHYVNAYSVFDKRNAPFFERDVYLQNKIENTYTIALFDITKRGDTELNNIFVTYIQKLNSRKIISNYEFVFYTFSDSRARVLEGRLGKDKFAQLQDDGSDDYLLSNSFVNKLVESGFRISVVVLNISKFFSNQEIIL